MSALTFRRRPLALPLLAASMVAALAGCASSPAPGGSSLTPATIQLGWISNVENMGVFVAERDGLYKDQGVDMTIKAGGPSTTVEPLVASGKALVGLSTTDNVARANESGADLVVVGATLQINPTSIMSLASAPISKLSDITGKRLCVQTSGVASLDQLLTANGIDPGSVKHVNADFDPSPLVTGQCDAFVSFLNNQPVTLKLQGIDTVTFSLGDYGLYTWGDVLFTKRENLKDAERRKTVKSILAATIAGWDKALSDPDAAAAYVVEGPGKSQNLDLEQQKLAAQAFVGLIRTDETAANGLLTMSETGIQKNITTMRSQGINTDFSALFDTSLLSEIAKG